MIYRTKENFIENNINPFTNMPYDSSWIIYQLTDSIDYQMINGGRDNGGVYFKSQQTISTLEDVRF